MPRLDAVVLAAGSGTRFGGNKLGAPWRGGRLIDGALAAALASPARRVFVVVGADRAIEAVAAGADRGGRLLTVFAPDYRRGLSASLRAGLAALPDDCEGVFVFLGDMPWVPHDIAAALAERLSAGATAAAPLCRGRRGHPVLFARSLFPALAAAEGDRGAREVLRGLGDSLALVATENNGVLADVDVTADLADHLGPAG